LKTKVSQQFTTEGSGGSTQIIVISPILGGVVDTSILFISEIVTPVNAIGYTPLLISGSINTGTFKITPVPDATVAEEREKTSTRYKFALTS
jgi:hypothetical protein